MKPVLRKVNISTNLLRFCKAALFRNQEIEITGYEVAQIRINRWNSPD